LADSTTDISHETINQRLEQLREEQRKGQAMLANLEAEASDLRAQLLRISGAIAALEGL